jgi:hypothetical protein
MLVVMHRKEHCEKGMKVCSLMGNRFVLKKTGYFTCLLVFIVK